MGFKFSIKGLLAAVAFVAFGCVALTNASQAMIELTSCIVSLSFLIAVVIVICRAGDRAFWIGFAILELIYLNLGQYLPTQGLLSTIHDQVKTEQTTFVLGIPEETFTFPTKFQFMAIGQCFFAIAFAFLGGVIARWVYSTGRPADSASDST